MSNEENVKPNIVLDSIEDLDIGDEEDWGKFATEITSHLNIDSVDDISCILDLSQEEQWDLTDMPGFISGREIEDAQTDTFSIGYMNFGTFEGKPCVAIQNAHPMIFLVSTADFEDKYPPSEDGE